MSKLPKTNTTTMDCTIQEKIIDLKDDVMTVLESYMDEFETDELFYHAIGFTILTLYQCSENHKQALKVLRAAMDDGIQQYLDKKDH